MLLLDEMVSALQPGECRKLVTWSPAEQIESKSAHELMLTLDNIQGHETNRWQGNALRVVEYVETTRGLESP